jgi:hypothetical protein
MASNSKLLERPAHARQYLVVFLEAFTRKIIALIKTRVKYLFAQFGNFKIEGGVIRP